MVEFVSDMMWYITLRDLWNDTVKYRPNAKQRLDKNLPAETDS
jgi:hypothetical protein